MFGPKVLEEFDSKFSGHVEVKRDWDGLYVTTNHLTQSGGLINELWNDLFKKTKINKGKSWLVLGLATGTVAKIISKKYKPSRIVGVEIDPDMIRIGQKYFDLGEIANLEVVVGDASKYKFEQFDYILVDMYIGDLMPEFVYSEKFLREVSAHAPVAVFNHLFYDPKKQKNAHKLIKLLGKIYPDIKLVRILTNILVICS